MKVRVHACVCARVAYMSCQDARGVCVAAYVNVSLQEKKKCGDSLDNTDAPNERERSAEP